VERLARLVVPGDPSGESVARLGVGLVDHVERGGQQVGVGGDLRGEPPARVGQVGIKGLSQLLGVELAIVPRQSIEGRRFHKSPYTGCGECPFLAQGLGEGSLELLIILGADGFGRAEPLDKPERADQWSHVVTGQAGGGWGQEQGQNEQANRLGTGHRKTTLAIWVMANMEGQIKSDSAFSTAARDRTFQSLAVLEEEIGVSQAAIEAAEEDTLQSRLRLGQAVVDPETLFAAGNQPILAEVSQVPRHRGLGQLQGLVEVADTDFIPVAREQVQ
jgi:hypothetical protein